MTGRAVRLIQCCRAGEVRRGFRGYGDTVDRHQGATDRLRQRLDLRLSSLVRHRLLQSIRLLLKRGFAISLRKRRHPLCQQLGELRHFGIFFFADHLAIDNGIDVIGPNVLDQLDKRGLV